MSDSKLYGAAEAGKKALVSQLIEQGAEVDWRGRNEFTALHEAARCGHTRVVSRILDSG